MHRARFAAGYLSVVLVSGCAVMAPSQISHRDVETVSEPAGVQAAQLPALSGVAELWLRDDGEDEAFMRPVRVTGWGLGAETFLSRVLDAVPGLDVVVKGVPEGVVTVDVEVGSRRELLRLLREVLRGCSVVDGPVVVIECGEGEGVSGETVVAVWAVADEVVGILAEHAGVRCHRAGSLVVCNGEAVRLARLVQAVGRVEGMGADYVRVLRGVEVDVVEAIGGVVAPGVVSVALQGGVMVAGGSNQVQALVKAVEAVGGQDCIPVRVALVGSQADREALLQLVSEVTSTALCGEPVMVAGAVVMRVRGVEGARVVAGIRGVVEKAYSARGQLVVTVRGYRADFAGQVLAQDELSAEFPGIDKRVYRIAYGGGAYEWSSTARDTVESGGAYSDGGELVATRSSRTVGVTVGIDGVVSQGVFGGVVRWSDSRAQEGGSVGVSCGAVVEVGAVDSLLCEYDDRGAQMSVSWESGVAGRLGRRRYQVHVRYEQ